MTKKDLQQIETELNVRLPDKYRQTMTRANGPDEDEFWLGALFSQPKSVIERTRWLADLMDSYKETWNGTWVAVSEVNGGDVVLLETGKRDAPLLLWDHETNRIEPFPTTLTEMAKLDLG